jgi:hypothetical protein
VLGKEHHYDAAMHHIRPYKLFTLLNAEVSDRVAHVPVPKRRGLGGISLLETFLLITAIRLVSAKRIFEFGTFLGSTTLNLALNSPDDAKIFTLDLDHDSAKGIAQDACDAPLTGMHLSAGLNLDFSSTNVNHKIETLFGNSREFDGSPWAGTIDLAFIDGGHDVPTASADTKNAMLMVRQESPSCILWHDYRNRDCEALTKYLDQLSEEIEIFHIEDTMLSIAFQGPHDHFSKLLIADDLY